MKGFAMHRLLATIVMAGALLVSSAGAASAQNWSVADPKGDVRSRTLDVYDGSTVPSPTRAVGDIWRTSISHTSTTVVVRITMRQLPAGKSDIGATIRTPASTYSLFRMDYGIPELLLVRHGQGGTVRCGAKGFRYVGTSAVLTVPRRCIGRPRWVRVGSNVSTTTRTGTQYFDDGLRDVWGNYRGLSPRIYPG